MPFRPAHRPPLRVPIRRAAAILSLGILLAACGQFAAGPDDAGAGPPLEREAVVDQPLDAGNAAAGDSDGEPAAASNAAEDVSGADADTPRPPTPIAMDNAGFATELAATAAAALAGSSAPIGQVLEIPPVDCGAISMDSDALEPVCGVEALRAGRLEGREYASLLVFDLSGLPLGAARDAGALGAPGLASATGVELLYAALELSGLDESFADAEASWSVRAVQLPRGWQPVGFSFGRLMGLAAADPSLAWRLRAADFPPDRAAGLDLEEAALAALQAAMGRGLLAFRIEGLASPGAADRDGLLAWHAGGERGPRLRLAYFAPAAP